MPIIISDFKNLYLSSYLMAEIMTHPYTKWQKSRSIPIPDLKNCDPSEWHLDPYQAFLGIEPPGKSICLNSMLSHAFHAFWILLKVIYWKIYHASHPFHAFNAFIVINSHAFHGFPWFCIPYMYFPCFHGEYSYNFLVPCWHGKHGNIPMKTMEFCLDFMLHGF